MTEPHYEVDHHEILKDGYRMFLYDVVDDIRALQRKVDDLTAALSCSAPLTGSALPSRFKACVRCGKPCDGRYLDENDFCPNCT